MLDASSVIALQTPPNRQRPVRTVLCPAGRRGFDATVSAVDGWLHPGRYTLHAAVRFDRPVRGARRHCAAAGPGRHLRAVARFDARRRRVVRVKVGLSFIGGRKALRNLRREIPDWRFRSVRLAAEKRWRRVLSRLEVEGGTVEQRRLLAKALFHTHLMPHELTGENAWWASGAPHYEDYYGLWDTHKALHPLLLLLQPRRERDMINSLVETFEHTGWMPDTRIAGSNGSPREARTATCSSPTRFRSTSAASATRPPIGPCARTPRSTLSARCTRAGRCPSTNAAVT